MAGRGITRGRIVTASIAFLAALAGVALGRLMLPAAAPAPAVDLHAVLHDRLSLDDDQVHAINVLERRFAVRRRTLEAEMHDHNRVLAAAIAAEHDDGPRVAAAIDASHRTMGTLQKETLAHVFAMRTRLRPDQAAVFDVAVTRALTQAPR